VKAFEEAFQFAAAMPAHDGSWNLVANGVTKKCRMAGAGAECGTHHPFDRTGALAVIEKGHRTFDRQPRHDPQSLSVRRVQQPEGRRCVGADRVHAVGSHLRKVAFHHLRRWKFLALLVRAKRPVGHAADIQFLVADKNKFALHPGTIDNRAIRHRVEPRYVLGTGKLKRNWFATMISTGPQIRMVPDPFTEHDGVVTQSGSTARMVVIVLEHH